MTVKRVSKHVKMDSSTFQPHRRLGTNFLIVRERRSMELSDRMDYPKQRKSTPWTDAGVDRNFQRDLGAIRNSLQQGRSNLVDPAEWPKISLLNRGFGSILSIFLKKNSKRQSSLNFLQSGPQKFTKPEFSGLAPIQ